MRTTTGTHFGPFTVESVDGQVTRIAAHPLDDDPSPIGQALTQHQQCRVLRPAVRAGWLADGPGPVSRSGSNTRGRGYEPFVEASWDEALRLVADELERVRTEHGPGAIFAGSYGWGSSGRFHLPSAQLHRFGRLLGGFTAQKGTYSSAAAEAIVPFIVGTTFHQAVAQQTSWQQIANHTQLFVSFGGLRGSNTDVTYGGGGTHHTRDWMRKAHANGTSFVSVSPLADDLDAVAAEHISVRPGTDVALQLALMHTLVVDGRADEQFLARCCEGWPQLKAYLLAGNEASASGSCDAAWAEEVTGVASDVILQLARRMADHRTLINITLSPQRAHHGEQTYWSTYALACVLGQVGKPGGGVAIAFGTAGNGGSGGSRPWVPGLPVPPRKPGEPVVPVSRISEVLERGGEPFSFEGRERRYPNIKLVYWAGGNPFHHHQDTTRLRAAWQRPDTVVVHEPFWGPMAHHADVVLPATTPLERSDIGGAEQLLLYQAKVAEPVGEARDDYEILAQLAQRLGFGEQFTEGKTADEWVETLYDIFRARNPAAPSFEEFTSAGWWRHEGVPDMGATDQTYLKRFVDDPEERPLRTPSGKIELYSERLAQLNYPDCGAHPTWFEPFERLGGAGNDRWPLHLVSNQPTVRLHSQYDFAEPSQATKVAGREPVRIHPATAAARGIEAGDVVRLFNDRGATLAGAVLDDALRPDVVQLSTGAWYDPAPDGTCRAGSPNVLTADVPTSQLGQGPSAHTCLVEIERLDGPAPPVRAYDPPEFVNQK